MTIIFETNQVFWKRNGTKIILNRMQVSFFQKSNQNKTSIPHIPK